LYFKNQLIEEGEFMNESFIKLSALLDDLNSRLKNNTERQKQKILLAIGILMYRKNEIIKEIIRNQVFDVHDKIELSEINREIQMRNEKIYENNPWLNEFIEKTKDIESNGLLDYLNPIDTSNLNTETLKDFIELSFYEK
jgi:hypothetical protein